MPDIETIQTWLPIVKDTVTILATAIAALVAISGYRTWKKQLHWKTQYDLAQRLLRATYKVRDAIAIVRNPVTTEAEISLATKEADIEGNPLDPKLHAISQKAVYNMRWQKLREACMELDTGSLEAEAIWGPAAKENFDWLTQCANTLYMAISRFLDNVEHPERHSSEENVKKTRLIVFGFSGEKDNAFSNETAAAVRKIEEFLKPYLKI
jgi:hypothetical protein